VIPFGCGSAALYYFPANSLNFGKQINIGQRFSEIPPNPPLEKGGKGGFLEGVWSWAKIVIWVAAQPRCVHLCPDKNFLLGVLRPPFP
jgi:hypothetical protein